MLENIKRIGLFMIVAQTFMHFAAGKQYEKYMKIISGVIVLLLFVSPFTSSQGNFVDQWQEQVERMTEQIENSSSMRQEMMPDTDYGTTGRVIQQLEEEIKSKLNYETKDEEYKISDVMIEWENPETEWSESKQEMKIKGITITLQQTDQGGDDLTEEAVSALVVIEEIKIETGKDQEAVQYEDEKTEYSTEQAGKIREYRNFFAEILEIDADKVEVVYSGRD